MLRRPLIFEIIVVVLAAAFAALILATIDVRPNAISLVVIALVSYGVARGIIQVVRSGGYYRTDHRPPTQTALGRARKRRERRRTRR
ncbi:MAG: hypothetical protein ACFB22_08305 [Rhodothalassiaceae bacterium]